MGGGDLNLKKSWHPATFKNREQIWLAEQAVLEEERKVEQLRRELENEQKEVELRKLQEQAGLLKKRPDRIEWMYSGQAAGSVTVSEAYLLGKKRVDEIIDNGAIPFPTDVGIVESLSLGAVAASSDKDLEAKLREDPLFAIKRREQEVFNSLKNNPWKIKQLKEQALGGASKAKKDEKEKEIRKTSPSRERSPKRSISRERKRRERENRRSPSRERERRDRRSPSRDRERRDRENRRGNDRYHHRNSSRERDDRERRSTSWEREQRDRQNQNKSYKSSRGREYDDRRRSPEYRKPDRAHFSSSRSRSREPDRSRSNAHYNPSHKSAPKPKLTEEEKQKRIQEMMNDAKWSDATRKERISEYEKREKEEKERGEIADKEKTFINNVQRSVYSTENNLSIEETLQRKRFTRERDI